MSSLKQRHSARLSTKSVKTQAKVKSKDKTKSKKRMIGEETEAPPKIVHLTPKMLDLTNNPRASISEFYVKRIEAVENKTHMVSNVSKYMDPLSTGYLCTDWLFNGGWYNGFASVSGLEGAAKSTIIDHTVASAIRANFIFSSKIDAEATMNEEYVASLFEMLGLSFPSMDKLPNRPYRYYKENVIEPIFDYMHALLKMLPQKIWLPNDNTWAYVFDKRSPEEAKKMEAYGVEPSKSLSRNDKFVCPTSYSGLEAAFFIDSFAAMVTESDDDDDTKSKRRAAEAAAFSEHLRRVSARISNRGVLLLGANQLRQRPNVQGRADPYYEPGGEALKFYTAQRARFTTRSSGFLGSDAEYNTDLKAIAEPSVIVPGSFDIYDYKHIKNTKNKMGNPKKETWMRVWVADHNGQAHGFDPVFDVYQYLTATGQLIKSRGGREGKNLKFNLRKSVGTNRASVLNALPPFAERDLKRLTLSEVFPSRELISDALKGMQLPQRVGLRDSLFEQLRKDKAILAIKTQAKPKKEIDFEAGNEF